MTRDEIIRMAREAGFVIDEVAQQHQPNCIFHTHHMVDELLERFAALVAEHEREHGMKLLTDVLIDAAVKAEREACAKVCELTGDGEYFQGSAAECAAAIRARGQE